MDIIQLKEHLDRRLDEQDKKLDETKADLKDVKKEVKDIQESRNFSRGAIKAAGVIFMGAIAIGGILIKVML